MVSRRNSSQRSRLRLCKFTTEMFLFTLIFVSHCFADVGSGGKFFGYNGKFSRSHVDTGGIAYHHNGSYFWKSHEQVCQYSERLSLAMREWANGGLLGHSLSHSAFERDNGWNLFSYPDPVSQPGELLGSGRGTCQVMPNEFFTSTACNDLDGHNRGGFSSGSIGKRKEVDRPQFQCPERVPVSILFIPKVMSSSLIRWASNLDRDVSAAGSWAIRLLHYVSGGYQLPVAKWDRSYVVHRVLEVLEPFAGNWYHNEKTGEWTFDRSMFDRDEEHIIGIVHNAVQFLVGGAPGIGGQWLPAPLCPKCCMRPTHNRLNFVVVRNPFYRLLSVFFWWCGQASRFPAWIDQWYEKWQKDPTVFYGLNINENKIYRDQYTTYFPFNYTDATESARKKCSHLGESVYDLSAMQHLSSQYRMMETAMAPFHGGPPLLILHMEELDEEWGIFREILCREFNYCEPIPKPPKTNFALNGGGITSWDPRWPHRTRDRIYEMFQVDFALLGYSSHPSVKKSGLGPQIMRAV